eukprot:jgi/Psemu1/15840/gm1.15840_g
MQIRASSIDDDTKAHITYNSFTTLTNNTSRLKRVSYRLNRNSVAFKFQTAHFQVFKLWLDLKAKEDLNISSSQSSIPLPQDTADAATMQPLVPLPNIHHEEPSISNLPPNLTTDSNLQPWDSLKLAPLHHLQDQQVQLCLYIVQENTFMKWPSPILISIPLLVW